MHYSPARSLLFVAFVVALSACTAGENPQGYSVASIAATGHPGSRPFLYVANLYPSSVTIYDENAKLVGEITQGVSFPSSLAFDQSGDLYVADSQGGAGGYYGTIVAYKPGQSTPMLTISEGIDEPAQIAVGPDNDLYVANEHRNAGANHATITVYSLSGALLRTIRDGVHDPRSLAFDSDGNLYVANGFRVKDHARDCGWVTVYAPGSTKIARTIRRGLDCPDALTVDPSNRLYVLSINNPSAARVNRQVRMKPQNAHSGPFVTIYGARYRRLHLANLNYPVGIALDDDRDLYAADAGNNTVTVYKARKYQLWYTISKDLYAPQVVALDDSGQLFAANEPNSGGSYPEGSVTVYAAHSSKLTAVISEGIHYPVALSFSANP